VDHQTAEGAHRRRYFDRRNAIRNLLATIKGLPS
jgi:hypothetical protein